MDALNALDQAAMTLRSAQAARAEKLNHETPAKAHKAAVDFEGFFIAMALEDMFAGIKTDGPFGGGNGEKIFRSMLLQQYGKTIAEQNSFGLTDAVQREMMRHQESQSHDTK